MTAFARYIGAAEFEEIAMADTKQSAWTPGPWFVDPNDTRREVSEIGVMAGRCPVDDHDEETDEETDEEDYEGVVSVACVAMQDDRATQLANAHLIAASPTMLAALERAERKLSAYVDVCKDDKELTGTVLPMAREAIRLARGGGG